MRPVGKMLGRSTERKRLLDALESRDIRSVVVYGHEFVGKSILLHTLANEWLNDTPHCAVYFDIEERIRTLSGFEQDETDEENSTTLDVDELTSAVLNQLAVEAIAALQAAELPAGALDERGDNPAFWRQIADGLADRQYLVIVLDSLKPSPNPSTSVETTVQAAVADVPSSTSSLETEVQDNISAKLSELLYGSKIKLVLGADTLDPKVLTRHFAEVSHQVRTIQLKLLSRDDTEQMLRAEDMEGLVNWDHKPALERVWELTNGHPAFIAAISSAVSDDVFQDIGDLERAKQIRVDMVDSAVPKAVDKINSIAGRFWYQLSEAEQAVLAIITYMQSGLVTMDTIELALNDIELSRLVWGRRNDHFIDQVKLNQINLPGVLAKLQRLNLLEQVGHVYRLPIGLMKNWILENHELPEDYERLIEKASMQSIEPYTNPASDRMAQFAPGGVRSRAGSKATLAVLVLLILGALVSLPFVLQTLGFSNLTSFIPGFGPNDQITKTGISAPAPIASANSVSDTPLSADGAVVESENGNSASTEALSSEASISSEEPTADGSTPEVADADSASSVDTESGTTEPQSTDETIQAGATFTSVQQTNVEDMIWSVAINIEESFVAAGLESGAVYVQPIVAAAEPLSSVELDGHDAEVLAVAFHPQRSSILASSSADRSIRLWDIESQETLASSSGHQDEIGTLDFNPDGTTLASGSADGTVKLWDAATLEEKLTFGGNNGWVLSVAFSADGKQLASGTLDGTIQLWNVEDGSLVDVLEGHQDWVSAVAFATSDGRLASASYDASVYLWDIEARHHNRPSAEEKGRPTGVVNSIAFHPSDRLLMAGQHDGSLLVWDLANPAEPTTLPGHLDAVRSAVFSPKGSLIATGALDGFLRLWQVSLE